MNQKPKHMKKKYEWAGLFFVLPFLIGIVGLYLIPVVQSLLYSFGDLDQTNSYKLVLDGIGHYYHAFFVDSQFVQLLLPSLSSMLAKIPIIVIFSFLVAAMLKNAFRGRNIFRMIMFLPVVMCAGIIPKLEAADLMQSMITVGNGTATESVANLETVTQILLSLNLNQSFVDYIISAVSGIFSVINSSGIQILIFLAALQSVPSSLYEASSIEGATAWEHFWKITFPMVSPQILVCVVYTIIDSFTNLNNPVMAYISDYIYNKFEYGYGLALSWIYFFIIIVILALAFGLISRFVVYSDK